MEKRSEEKIEHDRAQGLCVAEEWLRRDGFIKDANVLKKLRNYVPLATLWVIIVIGYHESGVSIDAYLRNSPEKPDTLLAARYVLGRAPHDDEGIIIKGPFLWPDIDEERFIAETFYGEATTMAPARPEKKEEAIRDEDLRPEPVADPEDLAQEGQTA